MRGLGSIYLRGNTWWVKYYIEGRKDPIRDSANTTDREEALNYLRRKQGEIAAKGYINIPTDRILVNGLLELLVDEYVLLERHDLYIAKKRISKHLSPMLGNIPANKLSTDMLMQYVKDRRKEGAENATINRELSLVRRAYTLASRMTPPKVAYIPIITKLPEDNVRQGFIGDEEYAKLRDALHRCKLVFVIGYHVGIRRGEILKLEWSMVDWEAKVIRIPRKHTKKKIKAHTIPIWGEMEKYLRESKAEWDKLFVKTNYVCHDKGQPILSFKKEWGVATLSVGMPNLLFHDLRRSAIRNMVRAGIPQKVAMEISGHKTSSMFERYNIVDEQDIRTAGEMLERKTKKGV